MTDNHCNSEFLFMSIRQLMEVEEETELAACRSRLIPLICLSCLWLKNLNPDIPLPARNILQTLLYISTPLRDVYLTPISQCHYYIPISALHK